jgi:hypothetical protein
MSFKFMRRMSLKLRQLKTGEADGGDVLRSGCSPCGEGAGTHTSFHFIKSNILRKFASILLAVVPLGAAGAIKWWRAPFVTSKRSNKQLKTPPLIERLAKQPLILRFQFGRVLRT